MSGISKAAEKDFQGYDEYARIDDLARRCEQDRIDKMDARLDADIKMALDAKKVNRRIKQKEIALRLAATIPPSPSRYNLAMKEAKKFL